MKAFPDDVQAHVALAGVFSEARAVRARRRRADARVDAVPRRHQRAVPAWRGARRAEPSRRRGAARSAARSRSIRMHAPTLNYLGYMFAERGQRLDEAVELIAQAVKIDPFNGSYLDSLGWAYFKQGKLDQAREYLVKAGEQMPVQLGRAGSRGRRALRAARRRRGRRRMAARVEWRRPVDRSRRRSSARSRRPRRNDPTPSVCPSFDPTVGAAAERLRREAFRAADRRGRAAAGIHAHLRGSHESVPRRAHADRRSGPVRAARGSAAARPAAHGAGRRQFDAAGAGRAVRAAGIHPGRAGRRRHAAAAARQRRGEGRAGDRVDRRARRAVAVAR